MSEESARYYEASGALSRLDRALESAISKDEAEAERWWGAEAWDFVTNHQQRQAFNDQVKSLKERARGGVTDSRDVLGASFEPHRLVPYRLNADAKDWRDRTRSAIDLVREVQAMSSIDGYTGPSANDYAQMVGVQAAAMQELRGVFESAARGAERGVTLNEALFAIARNAIKEAHELSDIDLPGGNGIFYRRTARWGDYTQQLPGVLEEVAGLDNVQDALDVLRGQLGDSLSIAELLEPGSWPSGLDAVGTAPGNTGGAVNSNVQEDTNFDIPDSQTPGVCTSGAYRS